ncbi:hypothetical protein CALCODRAFT_515272 [Calocera cornea HHB12733]|uniref:Uncharacterized protein n=1 Tax=Calocera cornea HHB12733 TaxID=1353952 RepID=A0A165IK93_9BASI|nr:hypothetical protein CALCODRAFT_515272 [Calocera cornea HHB12733]
MDKGFSFQEREPQLPYHSWGPVFIEFNRHLDFRPSDTSTPEQVELEQKLDAVLAKREYLLSDLRATEEEHVALMDKLRELSAPRTTPANLLPDDVLLLIFSMGIGTALIVKSRKRTHEDKTHHRYFQTAVSQVCRRWRSLATNYPSLWTDYVVQDTPSTDNPELDCWLSRSAGIPLRLWIKCKFSPLGEGYSTPDGPCPRFKKLIHRIVDRLSFLWIEGCTHTCLRTLSDVGDRAPLLGELHVKSGQCDNRHLTPQDHALTIKKVTAPDVTAASFRGPKLLAECLVTKRLRYLNLAGAHVGPVTSSRVDETTFLNILSGCRELLYLQIDQSCFPDGDVPDSLGIVATFPRLTLLELYHGLSARPFSWLARIHMPILKAIKLKPHNTSDWSISTPPTDEYLAAKRVWLSNTPTIEEVSIRFDRNPVEVSNIIDLLLEGLLPHLGFLRLCRKDGYFWNSSSHWSKDLLRKLTLCVRTRWSLGNSIPRLFVEPPLFEGEPFGKNYAAELLSEVDEIGELKEFGLEALFREEQ